MQTSVLRELLKQYLNGVFILKIQIKYVKVIITSLSILKLFFIDH